MTTIKLRAVLRLVPAALLALGCGAGGDGPGVGDDIGTTQEGLAPAGANATFVSTTNLPGTLAPGERRLVGVTMQNSGTTTWSTANPVYDLLANTPYPYGWTYGYLPGAIAPGGSNTFTIPITAPSASTAFGAQMNVNGFGKFGDLINIPITIDATATPQWGCTYDPSTSTIPTNLTPGESRSVVISLQNTGSSAWPSSGFFLYSQDSPLTFWSGTTKTLLTTGVAPGATTNFAVNITAPTTPGTYTFQREMYNNLGLGVFRLTGHCVSTSITVGGTPTLNAQLVSQNFPTSMAPSEPAFVSVTMKNTGTQTWQTDNNYMLYSLNSPLGLWSRNLVYVPTVTASGSNATFSFSVTAPATPGTYHSRWRMRKANTADAAFFGDIIDVTVNVSSSVTPQINASVVSQAIQPLITAGKKYTFGITMKNSGAAAWTGSSFMLYSVNTSLNQWGVNQSPLGSSETVAAGANRLFNLLVTAPATPGTYSSMWQMWQPSGVGYFGEKAITNGIVVTLCENGTIDAGETCDDSNLNNGDGCSDQCQPDRAPVDLSTSAARTILGTGAGRMSPVTIGDVTGDATPEVIVSQSTGLAGTKVGSGYVFGYSGGSSFLSGSTTIGAGDIFEVAGAEANDGLAGVGGSRITVGQIVGSATPDLVLSAAGADGPSNGRTNCGEVYVIGGGSLSGLIDLGLSPLPSQVTAHIIGANAGDGLPILGIADVTGDGQNDLVLGAPADATNGANAGAIYILSGTLSGDIDLAAAPPAGVTVIKILGKTAGDQLGIRAALGDLNADGKIDLLAGCPNSAPGGKTRAGAAFAKFGPITSNLDFTQAVGSASGPSAVWLGKNAFDGFGLSSAIGDVVGSATGEAVIGAIQYQKAGNQVGGVTVWSGVTSGTTYDLATTAPTSLILGAEAHDDCGSSLALGDINGDGRLDIAFGCSTADGAGNARMSSGEIDVVLGAASLLPTFDLGVRSAALTVYGPEVSGFLDRHEPSMSFNDINGDGKADLCGGSYMAQSGAGRVDCISSPF